MTCKNTISSSPTARRRVLVHLAAALFGMTSAAGAFSAEKAPFVNESAREIPVVASVDVLVVGGSTGAVSAAVTATEEGASVFLAAPRSYLGDDMTATLRVWLEENETPKSPLAKTIFHDPQPQAGRPSIHRMPFTYQADRPQCRSPSRHEDAKSPGGPCLGRRNPPERSI